MAVTNSDIINRGLQLLGSRTTVTSAELAANSTNEAIQANLVFTAIRDWCLGAANWNFARRTAALALLKQVTAPVAPWTATTISPPWTYEYAYPTDCIRLQYITNSNITGIKFLGEPKRLAVSVDVIATVEQRVILTNEPQAVCIYTAQITDPTEWSWMFERFMVSTLAWTLSMALTGDKELTGSLKNTMMEYLTIATQANLEEGLMFGDTTPEWIQALGINYPFRRQDVKTEKPKGKDRGNDDRG